MRFLLEKIENLLDRRLNALPIGKTSQKQVNGLMVAVRAEKKFKRVIRL